MDTKIFNCRICDSMDMKNWTFAEMMFGTRKDFEYKECKNCGCIQIKEYPQNIESYYPEKYYSFIGDNQNDEIVNRFSRKSKTVLLLYNHLVLRDILGKMGKKTAAPFQYNLQYLERINLKLLSNILDIGCGNGAFLKELYQKGFSNLTGIDKFIKEDFVLFGKIKIFKKEIGELNGRFDLITLHHVFEHMPHQKIVLKAIHNKLNAKGNLIIRIPIVNEAWKLYQQNWVQIDAPRHFYLHTIKSFSLLAQNCGFKVTGIVFDSYALQFWGSEQYKMDIPLRNDQRSYVENPRTEIFSEQQIKDWDYKSIDFNNLKKGDQAIFYLKKNDN